MPRVKIDYVVSFSSEDPEHPASNLLAWEVSKKKWLCKKGESSCSVVLQLVNAVKISAVHIGAYHSALVEVLVARSEKGNEQYQVLVPSSVFVPPKESRSDKPVERVRSFSNEQLAEEARAQRWDRVRVVCSQPYNKHCNYGLSFIHIDESGERNLAATVLATDPLPQRTAAAIPPRIMALDTFSSDEDDFHPGELFAKHYLKNSDSQSSASDTGAQIRQATSHALKNISDASTKLTKTPISKPSSRRELDTSSEGRSDRTRDTLLYDNDDEKPHNKIDKVVQRHKDQKERALQEKKEKIMNIFKKDNNASPTRKRKQNDVPPSSKTSEGTSDSDDNRTHKRRINDAPSTNETPSAKKTKTGDVSGKRNQGEGSKKRQRSSNDQTEYAEYREPHRILEGAVLVLSGYENPERGTVRNAALAMGARVERDWRPHCTHLICAFPNTPKLRAARAVSGDSTPAVLSTWVLQCSARRRLLPWQWFATEQERRRPERPLPPLREPHDNSDTDCDTDEEIEKVLRKQKAKVLNDDVASPSTAKDKRVQNTEQEYELTTDEEVVEDAEVPRFGGALPNFFDGYTFAIDAEESVADELSRYVKAYGGLVMQLSELDEDSNIDYIVCGAGGEQGAANSVSGGQRVSAKWVASCHRAGELLPTD